MSVRTLGQVRRVGVLFFALAVVTPLAGAEPSGPPPAIRATSASRSFCVGSGPISAAGLASGVSTSRCPLAGRVVVSGDVAVAVPPASGGVAAHGVGTPSSPGTNLRVTNVGGVVTATSQASTDGGAATQGDPTVSQRVSSPPACQDGAFKQQGHSWKATLKWGYQGASTPRRMKVRAAVDQIARGSTNVRNGRNNCSLRGRPAVSSHYVGRTSFQPNIYVRNGSVYCGKRNGRSTVGWGPLPGNLLGWTCYWWNARQTMVEADIRLSPSSLTVLRLPARCRYKFDLQSVATHEWGHAFGLLHPGSGHARLTMNHLLPPCSTAPRTLGLGDRRGMRKLYGLR